MAYCSFVNSANQRQVTLSPSFLLHNLKKGISPFGRKITSRSDAARKARENCLPTELSSCAAFDAAVIDATTWRDLVLPPLSH
jgi:hypothetical protein